MSTTNVALLQMNSCGTDQEANLAKGEVFCRRAREMGADVALFPEMWNIGYTSFTGTQESPSDRWRAPGRWNGADARDTLAREEARARWQEQAVGRDDPFIAHYRALAQELGMAIAITFLEKWNGAPRNSVSLIDRRGEIVLTYAKVQTCDFDEPEASCTPGDSFPVCELDMEKGAFRVGAMICHDREFPEIARILMLEGAELILTPNSCSQAPFSAYPPPNGSERCRGPSALGHNYMDQPCEIPPVWYRGRAAGFSASRSLARTARSPQPSLVAGRRECRP